MMPSRREIGIMRDMTSEFRPQVVQVRRPTKTSDGGGGVTTGTPSKKAFITARFAQIKDGDISEEIFGGATSRRAFLRMAVENNANIQLQDQVLWSDTEDGIPVTNTYEVLSIKSVRGWELEKRVILGSVESGGKL